MGKKINEVFDLNIRRVERLVEMYEQLPRNGSKKQKAAKGKPSDPHSDLLRAAVMLLHATLEDYLRATWREQLPVAAAKVLFPGKTHRSKPTSITHHLKQLKKSDIAIVKAFLSDMCGIVLDKQSYGKVDDIKQVLRKLGVDTTNKSLKLPDIEAAIARRHLIVHVGDRLPDGKSSERNRKKLKLETVRTWIEAVKSFQAEVATKLA